MAQQIINYGNTANDGTGDPLRDAFIKVDNNFNQIWAAGPVGSNITIQNNTVGVTNTNGNLILSPNGIGIIQTNRPLYPRLDNTYDLGAANLRYRSIYVGAGGITNDGNLILSSIANLQIPGGNNGYVIQTDGAGNLSWAAQTGSGNGNPGGANTQVQFNDNGLFGGSGNFTFDKNNGGISVHSVNTQGVFAGIVSVNLTGNTWNISGETIQTPTNGSWTSNVLTNTDTIRSGSNGFLELSAYDAADALKSQIHLEHGVVQINITNGTDHQWLFSEDSSMSAPGNITANGNISGNYIIGNGSLLTDLPGGVIQGNVPPPSPNDTTLWWDDITGRLYIWYTDQDGSQWVDAAPAGPAVTYGNANVSLYLASGTNSGNISTTGNIAGNYFVGNGSLLTGITSSASTGNIGFVGDAIYNLNGILLENADLSHGATASVILPVNGDANAIQVNNLYGNIILQAGAAGSFTGSWTFDAAGNLTAPGTVTGANLVANNNLVSPRLVTNSTNFNWSDPIVGITLGANTVVTLDNNVFGDPYSGQVTIQGVVGTTEANGDWYYAATNSNEFELFADAEGTPVDSTSWTAYTSGGLAFTLGYANIEINAQTITIRSDHGDYNNKIWNFNRDGTTVFPTLTVNLHNGGNQSGQVLQFGDSTQQAIISGPAPIADGYNAQRLIIQGHRAGAGEGGDVYLWAGDAENYGGDIKIYAGDADAGNVGDLGGYVNIDGGAGYTRGGQVEITGGSSSSGDGGYTNLIGGQGATHGGNIGIQGGVGSAGPGGIVTIQGGISSNGLAEYGNVSIAAAASTWNFNNTGNLVLPQGGIIYETNVPFGGLSGKTIALAPYGGTSVDQQLLVYPTAGADFNHLHLTTGNLWNTEMFLGNDDFYVKLANTGNIVINSNDSVGNTAQWNFGTDGNLTAPGNLLLTGGQIQSGIPTIVNDGINSIALSPGAQMDVYGFPFNDGTTRGQLTITGDISTTQALGTWYYQSVNVYTYQLYTDSTYTTLVDATTWTPYTGGASVAITKQVPAANIVINSNGFLSTFTNAGQLDLPGTLTAVGDIGTDGNVIANCFNGNANISNVTINSYTSVPQLWFKGQISSPQNVTTSTDTVSLWNNNTDPQSWGNVTTGHITPNKPGWYEIISRVEFDTNAAANSQSQINHQIRVNDNQVAISQLPNLTGNVPMSIMSTAMVEINGSTDYITTTCWSGIAGNAQQINGGNTSLLIVRWVST